MSKRSDQGSIGLYLLFTFIILGICVHLGLLAVAP